MDDVHEHTIICWWIITITDIITINRGKYGYRGNIYHRYLFRTDILLHLYVSSQRQQDQQPTKNLCRNLNLLQFYPT